MSVRTWIYSISDKIIDNNLFSTVFNHSSYQVSVRAKSWNPDGTTDDPEVELDLDLVDGRRPRIRREFLSELEFGVVELIEGRDTEKNRYLSDVTVWILCLGQKISTNKLFFHLSCL